MTDLIRIHGLRVETRIGVTEEERSQPQPVVFEIDIRTDVTAAASSDELADTVDYAAISEAVARLVSASECKLLEHLAAKVAEEISTFSGVIGVTVEAAKEAPPMPVEVDRVSVRLERA